MTYFLSGILFFFGGILWGIGFQKKEDQKIIKMLEVRLNHNRATIDNLNKRLGGKNGD